MDFFEHSCAATQDGFCLPSVAVAPISLGVLDVCCFFDAKGFICLCLTGSHRKMMRLEPTSTVDNGPPSCTWH